VEELVGYLFFLDLAAVDVDDEEVVVAVEEEEVAVILETPVLTRSDCTTFDSRTT